MTTVTRYVGTCPVCERYHRLHKMLMVHHGYRRPGHGEIEGDCSGVGWPPWELSPDGTVNYLEQSRKQLHHLEDFLHRLETGQVHELTVQVGYESIGFARRIPKYGTVTVADGAKFERALEQKIRETEAQVGMWRQTVGYLVKKIPTWREQPLITEEEEIRRRASAPERVQARETREAKRAEKLAKRQALDAKNRARIDEKLALINEYRDLFNTLAFDPSYANKQAASHHWIKMHARKKKKGYLDFWENELGVDEALIALGLAKRVSWGRGVSYADAWGGAPRS